MLFERSAGILLHPTSLPNNEGIGTLGDSAYQFIDWLHKAKIKLWQVLPLGPTGYGDSPYASFSSFAGNPLLIDLEQLVQANLLSKEEIQLPEYLSSEGKVDFGSVVYWKIPLLKKAAKQFLDASLSQAYQAFCSRKPHIEEYALFMSIKEVYDKKAADEQLSGKLWYNYWPKDLAHHEPAALEQWKKDYRHTIELYKVIQFFFYKQWKAVKSYAAEKGISIIGDIPIFVAPDSADVWANQHLFQLDENGCPKAVAGVPPDYFSATGQLWGNPLYNWDAMKADGFRWWIDRIESCLEWVDYIRIDHFRGFEAYWAIPFGNNTAEHGAWCAGPDHLFLEAIQKALLKKHPQYAASLPIIAEDLGIITEEVEKLRDDFHLPGMKVLQFAFSATEVKECGFVNSFLPHTYKKNAVVYTGTHDNTTLYAWLNSLTREDMTVVLAYLHGEKPDAALLDTVCSESTEARAIKQNLCRMLIKTAFLSTANFAVVPFQDLYALGEEARMNEPSTLGKNWTWRMEKDMLTDQTAAWLADLAIISGRKNNQHPAQNTEDCETEE